MKNENNNSKKTRPAQTAEQRARMAEKYREYLLKVREERSRGSIVDEKKKTRPVQTAEQRARMAEKYREYLLKAREETCRYA